MLFFFNWISFWLISKSTELVNGFTHAMVGNYSELNPDNCGITRFTDGFNDMCFKWHSHSVPRVLHARNATVGEVPWIVTVAIVEKDSSGQDQVLRRCGGALIAHQWILTARHCYYSTDINDYRVYLGHGPIVGNVYRSFIAEYHAHPDNRSYNDLALIKMNFSYPHSPGINSICLPAPDIINTESEYALMAGWGGNDFLIEPAQMGYLRLVSNISELLPPNHKEFKKDYTKYLISVTIDNQTFPCKGDSGGPLWQFKMGRAVLIGVAKFIYKDVYNTSSCDDPNDPVIYSGWVRVSAYIDWIKNVTQLQ